MIHSNTGNSIEQRLSSYCDWTWIVSNPPTFQRVTTVRERLQCNNNMQLQPHSSHRQCFIATCKLPPLPLTCLNATGSKQPSIAQLVERRTVVGFGILRSLVQFRLDGNSHLSYAIYTEHHCHRTVVELLGHRFVYLANIHQMKILQSLLC